MRIPGILKIDLEADKDEIIKAKVVIVFIKFYVYPFNYLKKKEPKKVKKRSKRKGNTRLWIRRSLSVLKTFKIQQFFVNIDTGDVILNARLFPVFALMNYKGGNFHLNFNGRNQFVLLVKNRPINIIRAFINP